MPFVSSQELAQLRDRNEAMARQLRQFEEMRPHLALAEEIRAEIVRALGEHGELSAQQIGELAYQTVVDREINKARDEIAASYEQEHRRDLYKRLLGEVATKEGAEISKQVERQLATDPKAALEIRKSARAEIAARAKEVVRTRVTAEQQIIINDEAERQIKLDHLDVQLALEGEIDLTSQGVTSLVKPGDKLELFGAGKSDSRQHLTLIWMRDANGKEGWVYEQDNVNRFYDQNGHTISDVIKSNRFVRVGCINSDLENGQDVIQLDRLVTGLPLVFVQGAGSNQKTVKINVIELHGYPNGFSYNLGPTPFDLEGSDFQTKDLSFHGAGTN